MDIKKAIQAILFFKAEPISIKEISELLMVDTDTVENALDYLLEPNSAFTLVREGNNLALGTSPTYSDLINKIRKQELEKDLSDASLETLSSILYLSPISKTELDEIRGVNCAYILRNLMMRGLIERDEDHKSRQYSYRPSVDCLMLLGISNKEDLPGFAETLKQVKEWKSGESTEKEAEVETDAVVQSYAE